MFAKAPFATDLTAHSTAVLDCLAELKAVGLQHVVLLNVIRHSEVPLAHSAINEESLANLQ
jgi:hypothetical protein